MAFIFLKLLQWNTKIYKKKALGLTSVRFNVKSATFYKLPSVNINYA